MSTTVDEKAVSITEIADLLGISPTTVYVKAKAGEIPGFKIGRVWRFFPSEVRAHLTRPHDPWAMPAASRRARRSA